MQVKRMYDFLLLGWVGTLKTHRPESLVEIIQQAYSTWSIWKPLCLCNLWITDSNPVLAKINNGCGTLDLKLQAHCVSTLRVWKSSNPGLPINIFNFVLVQAMNWNDNSNKRYGITSLKWHKSNIDTTTKQLHVQLVLIV